MSGNTIQSKAIKLIGKTIQKNAFFLLKKWRKNKHFFKIIAKAKPIVDSLYAPSKPLNSEGQFNYVAYQIINTCERFTHNVEKDLFSQLSHTHTTHTQTHTRVQWM